MPDSKPPKNRGRGRLPRLRSDRPDGAAAVAEIRSEWRASLDFLDSIVEDPAEPRSVLDQLAKAGAGPPLEQLLRLTVQQGTEFLRAALAVAEPSAKDSALSPVAPLARSGLLAFSKVLAIATPLCWTTRGLGPAIQHHHGGLVDAFLELDRHAAFDPRAPSSQTWIDVGRSAILDQVNTLRVALSLKPVKIPKGPAPNDKLVTEGSWIAEGQRCSDLLQELEGVPSGEGQNRMRWAWHRASVIAHAGFSAVATPDGLSYVYLSGEEASALLRHTVELAVATQRVLSGTWRADAAPEFFAFDAEYRLLRSAPNPHVTDAGD